MSGHRDRAVLDEGLHLTERAAEHERDVRLLVALRSLIASVRLSSSRNCENSGANLRVSACAVRRFHHFDTMMVSE
jgi:hypothetical protein